MNSELMIALYLLLDQKKETIACSSINLVRNAKAPKKNLDLRSMIEGTPVKPVFRKVADFNSYTRKNN